MDDDLLSQEPVEVFGPWEPPLLDHFSASRLKIERAEKHINDITALVLAFVSSDFYAISVEKNIQRRAHFLRFDIDKSPFPFHDVALLVGDVLHNLRSALDLLYHGTVVNPSNWTRFPIFDTREKLVDSIETALEKKQINRSVYDLILDRVKPYHAENYTLWALHDLNIRDKHQLLIPVAKFFRFDGVRLEDDKQAPVNERVFYMMDASSRIKLPEASSITLKDKGHATGIILFDFDTAFQNEPVIPTLHGIAEEVTRTVVAFKMLALGIVK
jgi:hypothetical protein